ncbi:AraC family transcriptional regulator [Nocardia sp. CDC160]|uniref:AraC family transcriptional regulator n=1 Tax=Nocardia sp. CDC160 TaxID=3112166 RepID=UPI002DBBE4D8|nr:AraC family transcriptional regulator [Nocardia sp. CDC160]MEC3919362.1 AraC family transcriptional regulator [Nocardia sp. CDC160]
MKGFVGDDWDGPWAAAGTDVLVRLAGERGMSAAECLAGTGLTAEALLVPGAVTTARRELRVVRNLLERFGDEPGLGIVAGGRHHISMYGQWGLALLSSRTLGDAMRLALRYVEFAFPFGDIDVEVRGDEAVLRFDDTGLPADAAAFLTERTLATLRLIERELLPTARPARRVSFRHARPSHTDHHRDMFGVEPTFAATANELALDAAALATPLPQADEWACRAAEQACRADLHRRRVGGGFTAQVRRHLTRDPERMPAQAEVAAALCMSPRTLARRLNAENTSFRALLVEVRRSLAEELLTDTDLTCETVAARLGYAEAAPFVRAFRRWKGCAPTEFRTRRRLHRDA